MPLLSSNELQNIKNDIENIFDSTSRDIIVYKEPNRVASTLALSNNLFGFGENQAQDAYVYTPVTGIFPAVVKYPKVEDLTINPEMVAYVSSGMVSIKVRIDCRNFIKNGKTQYILVDGRSFILDGDENVRRMFSQDLYEFNLKAMK